MRIASQPRQKVVEHPVGPEQAALLPEAERQNRDRKNRGAEADPEAAVEARRPEPGDREAEDQQARKQSLLRDVLEVVADRRGRLAPDEVLVGRGEENRGRAGEGGDGRGSPLRLRVLVGDLEVGAGNQPADHEEEDQPGRPRRQQAAVERWPAASPPDDDGSHYPAPEQVGERQTEGEAERELPAGDQPGGEQPPRVSQPHPAYPERQAERDPARGDHLQVPVLLEPEGGEGIGGARHRRSRRAKSELSRQQIGAEEGERVSEQEEEVVANDRVVRPRADQPGGRVADQGVPVGERVLDWPKLVRLEEVERLVGEGMSPQAACQA